MFFKHLKLRFIRFVFWVRKTLDSINLNQGLAVIARFKLFPPL